MDSKRPKPARVDHSDVSIREKLRELVDPVEIVDAWLTTMRDPSASHKDRLMASKLIADRRDGMPVGMVVTGHMSIDHAFGELPDAALDQLEAIMGGGYTEAQLLAAGDEFDDDDQL